jgi:uncharacterized protein YhaN
LLCEALRAEESRSNRISAELQTSQVQAVQVQADLKQVKGRLNAAEREKAALQTEVDKQQVCSRFWLGML